MATKTKSKSKKPFKNLTVSNIVSSIIMIAVGVMFLVFPAGSSNVVCYVAGALIMCAGVYAIVAGIISPLVLAGSGIAFGVLAVLLGVFFFVFPAYVQDLLDVAFALYLVFDGIKMFVDAIQLGKFKVKGWICMLVMAILETGLGIAALFCFNQNFLMMFIGISLIVGAVFKVATTIAFGKKVEKVKNDAIATAKKFAADIDAADTKAEEAPKDTEAK